MIDQMSTVEEMIGEYEQDIEQEQSRLRARRIERTRLLHSAGILLGMGEVEKARRTRLTAFKLDQDIKSAEQAIDRMRTLLALIRQRSLELRRRS